LYGKREGRERRVVGWDRRREKKEEEEEKK
jgi:hypothetical protein